MKSRNERKSKQLIYHQLGMPFGTAQGRLRKLILFQLVQETGKDICFRCNQKIESVNNLSIEHKIPWFNNSPKLFWDLNNIAFSHLSCNAIHGNILRRKSCPPGTNWCYKCKECLPIGKFSKDKSNWRGLQKICNKHRSLMRSKKNRNEENILSKLS